MRTYSYSVAKHTTTEKKMCIENRDFGLVVRSNDNVPNVIVTVQHNGLNPWVFDGLVTARDTSSVPDLRVMPIATQIFRQNQGRVAVIFNCIPRTILDTNVEEEEAYVDPSMKKHFCSYHQEVSAMIRSANTKYGRNHCFLLDLHGFVRQPEYFPGQMYDVVLGTRNLQTVKLSNCPEGWERIDKRFAQHLQESGLSVFLPESEPVRERLWREKVQQENSQLLVMQRPVRDCDPEDSGDEEVYDTFRESLTTETKHLENAIFPPSAPDFYNGGYLIHSHFREGVAAAVQVEISPELREPRSSASAQGAEKREGFISAVSSLISSL